MIFKTMDNELKVFGKTILTTTEHLKNLETVNATVYNKNGQFNLQGLSINTSQSVSNFTKLNNAFKAYNGNLTKSTQLQNAYIKAVGNQNDALGNYLAGLNGTKASMGGYIKSLIGAKVATIGLQVASTLLNAALSLGLSLALSAIVSGITHLVNKEKEAREQAIENAQTAKEEADNLTELLNKYNQLSEEVKTNTGVKDDLLETQGELLESLGIEQSQLDGLIKKYGDLNTAINKVTLDSLNDAQADLMVAVDAREKELINIGKDYKHWFSLTNRNQISTGGKESKQAYDILAKAGVISQDLVGTGGGVFTLVGDDKTVDGILENYQKLKEAQTALNEAVSNGEISKEDMGSNPLYKAINSRLDELKTAVDNYNSAIKDVNENSANQEIISNLIGKDLPQTEEEFETFKQSLIDSAQASNNFIGSQEDIKNSIIDALAKMPEFEKYFEDLVQIESDVQPFDISKYKDDIDDFQKKMTKLSTAYQGVVNGDLDVSDLVDLFQEFPELQNESDNLDRAIKKLSEESLQSLYDKLGENIPTTLKEQLRDIATQATQTVTKLKDAYSSLTTTYDAMYEMQEIMDNGGNLTSSVLSSISGISDELAVSVAEYNAGLITSNQLFDLLKEHYQTDLQNYYNLLVAKNQFNEEFYSNMGLDSAELINSFAEDYSIDLSNCKTYAEAKAEIENQTLGQIEGNWKNYYNAQTHTLTQQYRELAKVAAKNSAFGVPDSQNKELQLANSIWKMSRTYEKASTAYDTALSKRVDANFQKTQRNIKAADEASKNSSENAKKEEVQWKDLLDKEIELEEARFNAGVIDFQEYLKKRSGLIQKYYNEAKITAEEYYSELKDMYEAELAIYDKALSAVTKLLEDEVDKIDKSIDAINKKNDALNKEKEKYDNIISAVEDLFDSETDKINEQIDALEEKNDKLGEEQQKYEDVLSAIDKVYDTQIEAYNKEKDNIQDIIDGLQEENDEREREIALMKARYELERAQNQKTQYVYQDGQMVYKTDESAIRDAKEALDEAEFNKATAELNKQIEEIEKNIEALEKMKEKWQEIANARKEALEYQAGVDMFGDKFTEYILNSGDKDIDDFLEKYNKVLETIDDNTELIKGYNEKIKYYEKLKKNWTDLSSQHEKNINKQLATEKFGAEWEAKVLSGRLEGFESFKNRYLQIQDEVTNNEKLIKDLETKKTYYEELKEQWSSVSSAYEEGMNKQIAAMILGEDWEKKVLDNRKGVFEDFKNNYINIQHQIANATIDAAQAAINAAQSEAEAMQNSLGNTVGYINTVSDEYKKAAKDMEETTKNLSNQQKALSKFGTNGRFGTVEKFAKGGVVGESNDPTVKKLAQSMGEDTLVAAKVGERILTPEQSKHFEELVDAKTGATYTPVNIIKKLGRVDMERAMQNMRSAQSNLYSNLVANNNAVNSSAIPNYVKEVNVDQHITLTLPNVTNNAGVEYLQKTLSNMTQKAYQMINKH